MRHYYDVEMSSFSPRYPIGWLMVAKVHASLSVCQVTM